MYSWISVLLERREIKIGVKGTSETSPPTTKKVQSTRDQIQEQKTPFTTKDGIRWSVYIFRREESKSDLSIQLKT